MKKYIGSIFRGMITALCAVMVLASCQNVLSPQETEGPAMGPGKGLVSLRLGDSAVVRTILPEAPAFTSYELSFSKGGDTVDATTEQEAALASGNEAQVELDAGEWTASIKGYRSFTIGETAKEYLAATGNKAFTVSARQTNQVTVDISPLAFDAEDAPQGIFTYAISLPAGVSEATLTLDNTAPINLLPAVSASAGSVELDAGVYDLVITLEKDGLSAGVSEVVYIYPGLESKAELDLSGITFAAQVFLMGTASAEHPEGVTLPYTVTAYSDAEHTDAIDGATASVAADGGTWLIKIPASFVGQDVYLKALAAGITDTVYTASAGTAAFTPLAAKGQAGIALTVPVTVSDPVLTDLNAAIEAANTAKTGVVTSVDGKDKIPGTKWVTSAVMTALTDAIEAAEAVKDNAITQSAVNSAVTPLNNATDTFTGAIATANTVKTTLDTAISEANTATTGIETSADGTDITGTRWVIGADMTALTDAIAEATTMKDKADATQNEVDGAVSTLNGATATFADKVKTNAATPAIITPPAASAAYQQSDIPTALTVAATISDSGTGGVLSYQWYRAMSAIAEGTSIASATSASYAPPTDNAGIAYYYVVVTNTNSTVNGISPVSTTSSRAEVTVTYSGVSVNFSGLPENESIDLTGPGSSISWTANTAITFTVAGSFSAYAWDVDGLSVSGATTASLSLAAKDYSAGDHTVTAKVTTTDGKIWSKQASFNIGQ